jgi:hypothetical protein
MKQLILLLLVLVLVSCNVEMRIKDYSYTDKWYFEKNQRYQVYKTKKGNFYILVLNNRETKFKRKYIKI